MEKMFLKSNFSFTGQSNATSGSLVAVKIPHRVGDCYDKLPNDQCFNYNDNNCYGIYAPWAIENCRLRCGFCENMQPPCIDQIPNCNLYSKSDCVSYDKWGRYTCRKFCGRCIPPTQSLHFTTLTTPTKAPATQSIDLTSNHVAFTVNGVKDRKNLGPHQTIVFKSILTNVGHSFNQPTGIFTCTIPGVYVFYCSIVVNADADIKVSIVKDGVDTTFAYQPVGKNQGGTMSIIHLNAGESVWVRMAGGDFIGNAFEDVENSFSGFLLYPDL